VPEPSVVEVEIAIGNLESYKSPGTDQIPAELIKAGVKHYVPRYTNLLVLYGIRRIATAVEGIYYCTNL
jgi:hypothetical protein